MKKKKKTQTQTNQQHIHLKILARRNIMNRPVPVRRLLPKNHLAGRQPLAVHPRFQIRDLSISISDERTRFPLFSPRSGDQGIGTAASGAEIPATDASERTALISRASEECVGNPRKGGKMARGGGRPNGRGEGDVVQESNFHGGCSFSSWWEGFFIGVLGGFPWILVGFL